MIEYLIRSIRIQMGAVKIEVGPSDEDVHPPTTWQRRKITLQVTRLKQGIKGNAFNVVSYPGRPQSFSESGLDLPFDRRVKNAMIQENFKLLM